MGAGIDWTKGVDRFWRGSEASSNVVSILPRGRYANALAFARRGDPVRLIRMRMTEQRRAILSAFNGAGRPLSPTEVLELASEEVPQLNLTTVYRNLKGLVEREELVLVALPGQAARYELAGLDHHHHFLCEGCDRVFDVPGCPGSIQRLTPAGFETTAHEVTLVGRCRGCA